MSEDDLDEVSPNSAAATAFADDFMKRAAEFAASGRISKNGVGDAAGAGGDGSGVEDSAEGAQRSGSVNEVAQDDGGVGDAEDHGATDDHVAGQESAGGDGGERRDVERLGEALGLEGSDLYGLTVPVDGGEAVTLGEMKDAWKDRERTEQRQAARAAELDERDEATRRERGLLSDITSDLMKRGDLTLESVQRWQAAQAEGAEAEFRAIVALHPELGESGSSGVEARNALDAQLAAFAESEGIPLAELAEVLRRPKWGRVLVEGIPAIMTRREVARIKRNKRPAGDPPKRRTSGEAKPTQAPSRSKPVTPEQKGVDFFNQMTARRSR